MTNSENSVLVDASENENILREAMNALRGGDVIVAAQLADTVRKSGQTEQVLIVFAAISHSLGRDLDALSMLEQAMKQAPGVGNYPDAAAAILLKLGRKVDGIFNLKLGTHLPSDPFLDEIVGDFFGNIKDVFDSFIDNRPLVTAQLMMKQGLYNSALQQLETYIGVSGGDVESFSCVVECAVHTGASKEAQVALDALTILAPHHPRIEEYRLGVAILRGDQAAVAESSKTLPPVTSLEDALTRYRLLSFSPLVPKHVVAEALDSITNLVSEIEEVGALDPTTYSSELSIGFVCAAMGAELETTLLQLRNIHPVKVYFLGTGDSPSLRRVRAELNDDVRDVASIDDATLIEMVRADGVGILFDCIGTAPFSRPTLWRTRLAPIQILWRDNDNYDDVNSYDYRLLDGGGKISSESRIIDLQTPLYYPLPPAELMGRIAELRALTVTRGGAEKAQRRLLAPYPGWLLTDAALELYFSILAEVPAATLAFVTKASLEEPLVERVLRIADRKGQSHQIDLIDPSDFSKERHEIILDCDLILDSIPFGSPGFVAECLWISSPILALEGNDRRERASANLLRTTSVSELIATSPKEYVDRAVSLLNNPNALSTVRSRLLASQKALTPASYTKVASTLGKELELLWGQWYRKNT